MPQRASHASPWRAIQFPASEAPCLVVSLTKHGVRLICVERPQLCQWLLLWNNRYCWMDHHCCCKRQDLKPALHILKPEVMAIIEAGDIMFNDAVQIKDARNQGTQAAGDQDC